MSTIADEMQDNAQLDAWLDKKLDELLPKKLEKIEAAKTPSMSIIATKGTLDWAYPRFILASTAAALGWEVTIFFTFYGLLLLKKEIPSQVSPLGNPAMPMKMPFGPKWFQDIEWPMPNLVMAGAPAYAEDDFRELTIGEVPFVALKPCSRCVIVDTDPEAGVRAPGPLAALLRAHKIGNKPIIK